MVIALTLLSLFLCVFRLSSLLYAFTFALEEHASFDKLFAVSHQLLLATLYNAQKGCGQACHRQ
jgi:hypothetical protein